MGDLRDPKVRQKFLQDCISRNLRINKKKSKGEPDSLPISNINVLARLVELLEDKDEAEYHRLLKQFGLGT